MADTPIEVQQHNERIRVAISVVSSGGLALFGAFAATLYNGYGTEGSLAIAVFGLMLICISLVFTKALREEGSA